MTKVGVQEFDDYSKEGYEDLIDDPLKRRLGGSGDFFHRLKLRWMLPFIQGEKSRHLDLGCGEGPLLTMLRDEAPGSHVGVDVSQGMLEGMDGVALFDGGTLPFPDETFDTLSIACVLHHVLPEDRPRLFEEMARVLKAGGRSFVFEHNPFNPLTRFIVSRTPVDENAILLKSAEVGKLARSCFESTEVKYYLFFPQALSFLETLGERALSQLPLGGQYCAVLRKAQT